MTFAPRSSRHFCGKGACPHFFHAFLQNSAVTQASLTEMVDVLGRGLEVTLHLHTQTTSSSTTFNELCLMIIKREEEDWGSKNNGGHTFVPKFTW